MIKGEIYANEETRKRLDTDTEFSNFVNACFDDYNQNEMKDGEVSATYEHPDGKLEITTFKNFRTGIVSTELDFIKSMK